MNINTKKIKHLCMATNSKLLITALTSVLIGSTLLNGMLFYKIAYFKRTSVDLKDLSFSLSNKPPDIFGVKENFKEGDKVISIVDRSNRGNSVVLFYPSPENSHAVVWSTTVGGYFYAAGITNSTNFSSDAAP